MNHNDLRAKYPDLFKLTVDERVRLAEKSWESIVAETKDDRTPVSEAIALALLRNH